MQWAAAVPQAIVHALRHGLAVTDPMFDAVYAPRHHFRSWLHWTPLDVATRACALLAAKPGAKILDIGAGVGKLCLVGALTTSASWFGIEHDAEMVSAASAAALALGVQRRTTFMQGDFRSVDWSRFDAFYLFNPFAEELLGNHDDALTRREAYVASVDFVQRQLATAATGTRVVTYHGFGGTMPPGYDLVHREPALEDELVVWVRRASRRRSGAGAS